MKPPARWLANIVIVTAALPANLQVSADDCVPRAEILPPPMDYVKFHFGCRDDALRYTLQIQFFDHFRPGFFTCPTKK